MTELLVISGPANSGKLPLAKVLLREDPLRVLVHRDPLREMFTNPVDEMHITWIMRDIAHRLLEDRYSPIICAWNLEPIDRIIWEGLRREHLIPLQWFDTRKPEVQAMIPPLQEEG